MVKGGPRVDGATRDAAAASGSETTERSEKDRETIGLDTGQGDDKGLGDRVGSVRRSTVVWNICNGNSGMVDGKAGIRPSL